MKIEEMIKKVDKVNKLNKELHINKTIYFEKIYWGEVERFWIDYIVKELKERIFTRFNSNDSWYLEIPSVDETLYFDLFIKEIEN